MQSTAEIVRLAPQADLIGWQEISQPSQVEALHSLEGFEHYLPGGTANFNAISWRTAVFELVSSKSTRVHKGVAAITPSRWINTVLLRHKPTGKLVIRKNTHVINGIESGGLPIDNLRRTPLAKTHFQVLRAEIEADSEKAPVIWGGDTNVNYLRDRNKKCPWFPYMMLSPVCTLDMPEVPTHGNRCIDWTGHTEGLTAGPAQVQPLGYSDHQAVRVDFTFA